MNNAQPAFTAEMQPLKLCLQVYSNPQQSQSNIREAENYLTQCKTDPEFPNLLLKLFENESENLHTRLLAFIQFKNLIKETWRAKRTLRQTNFYSEEFKSQVRTFLVKCLEVYQNGQIRKQLDDALRIICFCDFPAHYQSLVDYFFASIESLNAALENEHTLMGESTVIALRTLKTIMTERSPKKVADSETIFYTIHYKFIQGFHKFWDYFHTHLQSAIESSTNSNNHDQIVHFLKLSRMADTIYLAFLYNGCEEMVINETVVQVAALIIQRAAELTNVVQILSGKKEFEETYMCVSKNLYKLLYGISHLQLAFPLLFKDVLIDYLKLLELIITNAEAFRDEYVLKTTVVCLTSVVKCYLYYSNDIYLLQKRKMEKYGDCQNEVYKKFHGFFTAEKIQTFFQLFLVNLLPKRHLLSSMDANIENFEELIEIEDEQNVDDSEKLENSLYRLTLSCTMAFLLQLSELSIPIIHEFCNKVVTNQVQMPSSAVLDGLFSIVGLLPVVYRKKNIEPSQYLDFESVLKYLEGQARVDVNLAKRIPVLIHKWLELFNLEVKAKVIQLIVQITKTLENNLIRYECCMCLKAALESDVKMGLDYTSISEQLVPVVVDILHKSLSPYIVWGLIGLLKVIFIKAQYTAQNTNIVTQIQNLGIGKLIKLDYEPLLNAITEMLKSMIAAFPPGTELPSIYQLCLEFIDYQLELKKVKFFTLSLWLFIAKEYSSVQKLDEPMKMLFAKYYNDLLALNSPYDLSTIINIIEEYLLAELLTANEFQNILKIIETTYEKTMVNEPTEEVFEVKASVLSLISTLLLTLLESKAIDSFAPFDNIIQFLLKDLFNNFQGPSCRVFRIFKSSSLTLINRFIILDLNRVFETIQKFQVSFNDFVGVWVSNMNSLTSKPAIRLNVLAILQVVPYIEDRDVLLNSISVFVKHAIPEVEEYMETGGQTPNMGNNYISGTHERLRDVRDSERKKASRQAQLYFEANIAQVFIKVFREAISKFGLSVDEIQSRVKDEGTVGRFIKVLEVAGDGA